MAETWDSPTAVALAANEQVRRHLVYIHGKTLGGDPATFGYWEGVDDIGPITVIGAEDGADQARTYVGSAILDEGIDEIVETIGLESNTITIRLAPTPGVLDMVRGNNIRHGMIELHRSMWGVTSRLLVSKPVPIFLGYVDKVAVNKAEVGGASNVEITCTTDVDDLTRTNPAKKSDEQQQLRSGDRLRRYSDGATTLDIVWGGEKQRAK